MRRNDEQVLERIVANTLLFGTSMEQVRTTTESVRKVANTLLSGASMGQVHMTTESVCKEGARLGIDWVFQSIVSSRELMSVRRRRTWRPPTDVYETGSYVVVKVEVAGMREGDFRISLANRTLSIAGRREDPAAKLAYQQMEINYGDFRTDVYLPWPVAKGRIEASYDDGFLVVRLPKVKAERGVPVAIEETLR